MFGRGGEDVKRMPFIGNHACATKGAIQILSEKTTFKDKYNYYHLYFFNTYQLYEGLKAYRGVDGSVRVFRPYENMKRMLNTAARATLPVSSGKV